MFFRNFAIAFGFISFHFVSHFFVAIWTHLENGCRRVSFAECGRVIRGVSVSHVSAHTHITFLLFSCTFCSLYLQLLSAFVAIMSQFAIGPISRRLCMERNRKRMRCNCLTDFPLLDPLLPLLSSLGGGRKFLKIQLYIRNCILNASQLPQLSKPATAAASPVCVLAALRCSLLLHICLRWKT